MTWRLMVHGGCGALRPGGLDPDQEDAARAGLNAALDSGEQILSRGGSALDAVEAAARVLEDDPVFNAGRGSALNYEGGIDLDAAIMDGATRDAGAVAGIHTIRCPISLARAVMEKSSHVLLSFEGAEEFAREHGFETVDPKWFETEERRSQLDKVLAAGGLFDADVKYGTIGAVALDEAGHVAGATSTGGLTAKRWGRIGDSCLIGAGTYADDRSAAVSATELGGVFHPCGRRAPGRRPLAAGGRIPAASRRRDAGRHQAIGWNRRADRCRTVRRGGLGLHHQRHVSRRCRRRRP
jgi:L-asparaginase / beta-aspartyl-peptidase